MPNYIQLIRVSLSQLALHSQSLSPLCSGARLESPPYLRHPYSGSLQAPASWSPGSTGELYEVCNGRGRCLQQLASSLWGGQLKSGVCLGETGNLPDHGAETFHRW